MNSTQEKYHTYDHLEKYDPLFGGIPVDAICKAAVQKNFGAVRLASALVRAIDEQDKDSSLGKAIRKALADGAF